MWYVSKVKQYAEKVRATTRAHFQWAAISLPGLAFALMFLPAAPRGLLGLSSFSLDLTGMVDFAETIFNSLAPIVVIVGGIVLGIGLVGLVIGLVMKAVRGSGRSA
jgi:hypothetical protein